MLRAIQSAADLSTPVTLRDHALYNRAGPQTPLANLREEGREAESGTDYFPAQSDRQDQQATPQRSKSSPTVPIRQTSDKPGNTNGSEQQTSPASPAVMTPSVLAEQGQAGHDGQSETDSTVLLVEDNDVNMKVGAPTFCLTPTLPTTMLTRFSLHSSSKPSCANSTSPSSAPPTA